jgi:hypothetical protein
MDELALKARPERLGDGVVEARGDAAGGLGDTVGDTEITVGSAQILRSTV